MLKVIKIKWLNKIKTFFLEMKICDLERTLEFYTEKLYYETPLFPKLNYVKSEKELEYQKIVDKINFTLNLYKKEKELIKNVCK